MMPFWMWTWVGPRNHVLDGGPDPHRGKGNFESKKGRPKTCLAVDTLKASHQGITLVWCRCRLGCTRWGAHLVPPGKYNWTIRVWQQCGLMSLQKRRPGRFLQWHNWRSLSSTRLQQCRLFSNQFLLHPWERLRSIVMSMSVCVSVCPRGYLRNHTCDLYEIFCACCLCPWLDPPLACWW